MAYNSKKSPRHTSIPAALGAGWIVGWIITILMAVVITVLVAGQHVNESAITIAAVITITVASFMAAITASGKVAENRIAIWFASGAIYFISLLGCTALFFDGSYRGIGGAALTIACSSAVAGLLGMKQKKHKIHYSKKRHNA